MKRKFCHILVLILIISTITPAQARVLPATASRRQAVDTDPYSLISAVNALRVSNGLAPYAVNSILMSVAQQHAQYMATNGVSHFGSGGSSPWQRGLAAGYPLAGELSLGGFYSENITAGNNKSVQDAVAEWQGDAPHTNTMLSSNLHEIGAGVALVGDYVYYVIDCASPTSGGQPPIYSPPLPGGTLSPGGPLLVNTIVPATPRQDGRIVHEVKPGESLWLIAISYGLKIVELRKLNNLAEGASIFPGDKLLIGTSPTPTALPPTFTISSPSSITPSAGNTPTAAKHSATPTLLPKAPVSLSSNMLVLGVIVLAALVLAAVFVRARKND